MRILIVSDAWHPQVNGVVRTLDTVRQKLIDRFNDVEVLSPADGDTFPCPSYPEIRLSIFPKRMVTLKMKSFKPEAIHIATEGPLGWAARSYCLSNKLKFTTSFHTRFPEYIEARFTIPPRFTYGIFRRFHAPSQAVMVTTASMERSLEAQGFKNLCRWTRGVDTDTFKPNGKRLFGSERPVLMCVGRVAVEKNIEEFLNLPIDATKVVVGDGPQLEYLKSKYQNAIFTGAKFGQELVDHYNSADCFVFPSKTDTFGLVILEALACGTPVAAHPVEGPIDVIGDAPIGVLDANLELAVRKALLINRDECRTFALNQSWDFSALQFLRNLKKNEVSTPLQSANEVGSA